MKRAPRSPLKRMGRSTHNRETADKSSISPFRGNEKENAHMKNARLIAMLGKQYLPDWDALQDPTRHCGG